MNNLHSGNLFMSGKKKLFWSLFSALLAGLTIWAVMSQSKQWSLESMIDSLKNANPLWLCMAVLCTVMFVVFECAALCLILKGIGYAQPGFGHFYTKCYPNLAMADTPKELATKHQVTVHLEMLQKALGLKTIDDRGLEMKIPDEAENEAARLWQKMLDETAEAPRPVIAFNIGASWATKRWIDTYFAQCADQLIEEGCAVAFFGGPTDVPIVDACLAKMRENGSPHCHIFTGKVTLAVLAGLLSRCALMLTTDSGPMHIGVSQNLPLVTMFGAHDCLKQGDEHMACMKHIPVEEVMKYVHELLGKYGGKAAKELPRENADGHGSHACRIVEL